MGEVHFAKLEFKVIISAVRTTGRFNCEVFLVCWAWNSEQQPRCGLRCWSIGKLWGVWLWSGSSRCRVSEGSILRLPCLWEFCYSLYCVREGTYWEHRPCPRAAYILAGGKISKYKIWLPLVVNAAIKCDKWCLGRSLLLLWFDCVPQTVMC